MPWVQALALVIAAGIGGGCPNPRTRGLRQVGATAGLDRMPPLIPRHVLFAASGRARPKISPDGRRLAYLDAQGGVINVWVRTLGKSDARAVTQARRQGISRYFWGRRSEAMYYLQDRQGDENDSLFRVDLKTRRTTRLTPVGVRATVVARSRHHPDELLIALNRRQPSLFDVYRLGLSTGRLRLDTVNPGGVLRWLADFNLQIRAARRQGEQGRSQLLVRDQAQAPWRVARSWGPAEQGRLISFTKDGRGLHLIGNKGRDKARLLRLDVATGATREVASDPRADLSRQVLVNPEDFVLEAVGMEYARLRWKVLDPRVARDFRRLRRLSGGLRIRILSRSDQGRLWVVMLDGDVQSPRYVLYDRPSGRLRPLFAKRPALSAATLAPTLPTVIRSRDGLPLLCYVTLPPGRKGRPLPMVLLVHGGPWSRDVWQFNPSVQWLANRGYVVLQVNFRGSAGFGKAFLNAGNREWGRRMQHDLTDAVRWARRRGIAGRVAIMGGSYGGYAALAGVAFTPALYAAAVDHVGPSNLLTLLSNLPPYWKPLRAVFWRRVGHPTRDRALLRARSPLFSAHRIKAPLFISQGRNDPRVKEVESEQIVRAIRQRHGRVQYVVYPDEGHSLRRWENLLDFTGRVELFLARHLGGRAEPWRPLRGSSAQVR